MRSDESPDRQNWQREVERTVLRGVQAGMSGDVDPPYIASDAIEKRLWERPFHCANIECLEELGRDHVTLITTAHVRRFCSVECIGRGQQAHERSLHQQAWLYGKLMNEAMARGDEPTAQHFQQLQEQATYWQRALSLHRHRCEPEPVPSDDQPDRDEDALAEAAHGCTRCMADAKAGHGYSVT